MQIKFVIPNIDSQERIHEQFTEMLQCFKDIDVEVDMDGFAKVVDAIGGALNLDGTAPNGTFITASITIVFAFPYKIGDRIRILDKGSVRKW